MRDVFSSQDITLINEYRGFLEQAGIPCFIRDESGLDALQVALWPTLCVTNDEDYDKARQTLQELMQAQPRDLPDWICVSCGSSVPGNFDRCWHCGTAKPAQVDS